MRPEYKAQFMEIAFTEADGTGLARRLVDALWQYGPHPIDIGNGEQAVSVTLNLQSEIWNVGQDLGVDDCIVPAPKLIVGEATITIYWPMLKWPEDISYDLPVCRKT